MKHATNKTTVYREPTQQKSASAKKTGIARKLVPAILSGVFCFAIFAMAFIALIAPKPKVSQTENRVLELMPKFSFSALMSGDYTAAFELYYSDTFPFRDTLADTAKRLEALRGPKSDDSASIYDGPNYDTNDSSDSTQEEDENSNTAVKKEIFDAYNAHNAINNLLAASPEAAFVYRLGEKAGDGGNGDTPDVPDVPDEPIENPLDGEEGSFKNQIFVVGNTAFEIFGRNDAQGEKYAEIINKWRAALPETVNVYNLVIPKNSAFALPSKYADKDGDQKAGIEHIYSKLSEGITPVRIFDALYNNRDEYIFFRTDHHWTQRGAYYAYREFAKAAGFTPLDESDFEIKNFEGYLGTLYDATKDAKLKNEPDYVETFYHKDYTFSMTYYNSALTKVDRGYILRQKPTAAKYSYGVFIDGDNPLTIITNKSETKTGKKLVVVKESYGNCFVPFVAAHYDEVYVVDQRYYNNLVKAGKFPKLAKLIEREGITDVLFINNMQAALGGLKNHINSLL